MKNTKIVYLLSFILTMGICQTVLSDENHDHDIKFKSLCWTIDDPSDLFEQMEEVMRMNHRLNILASDQAELRVYKGFGQDDHGDRTDVPFLTDCGAGDVEGNGRIFVNGSPARIVYYLGKPRSIHEIRVFSWNPDIRCNQDYEVRFADNSSHPGEMPVFPEDPALTSGDTVVGNNYGGVFSFFYGNGGGNLFEKKYDWVEFRFWRTFDIPAGDPGKAAGGATGWSVLTELQVIEDPLESGIMTEEECQQNAWDNFAFRIAIDEPEESFALMHLDSLKRALDDMREKYSQDFDAKDYEERWERIKQKFTLGIRDEELSPLLREYKQLRREVLLSNPLLKDFPQILARRTSNPQLQPNWISDAQRTKGKQIDSIIQFSPTSSEAEPTEILKGYRGYLTGDVCLHWDADRFLFTGLSENATWQIFEYHLKDKTIRQVTPDMGGDVDNVNGCYVPDGSILFVSSASMMGVPCVAGRGLVGNIYRLEPDGKTVRQLTFEQDQDWNPMILPNGRVLYLRWEYVDLAHYFSRIVFTMNPDGTNQVEHYGSGSYWPNSIFYARPLPGQSSKFVGIVSGHHGVPRQGEIVLFDPLRGRQEAQGVIQRIPGYGQKVEPVVKDRLVNRSWPRFVYPWPLSDDYFLTSGRMSQHQTRWSLYLVDVFDNILSIQEDENFDFMEPIPLTEEATPEVIPDRPLPEAKESTVFITDIYFGQGLSGVPRDTVKKLRLYEISYGYRGIGGHDAFGVKSCWDGRRILGEVPVFEDGSVTFKIPANTPMVIQPLDENGAAVQLMRSWFVGMPGENVSCIGCHETQNSVSPGKQTIAQRSTPLAIEPFYGAPRPISFSGEIQPILDRYCVGCHDGTESDRPNFADTTPGESSFSRSYHALHPFVRRPGPESNMHVLTPMDYHVSTSELVQMLQKGHHNVQLDQESWRRLFCWIDLNVPYYGTWTEVVESMTGQKGEKPIEKLAERYVELKNLYAGSDHNYEADSYYHENKEKIAFEPPAERPEPDRTAPKLPNWPFDAQTAETLQAAKTETRPTTTIRLSEKVSFDMVKIPAGSFVMGDEEGFVDELPRKAAAVDKPFWMMTTEVTNALYQMYNKDHQSGFIDLWDKDQYTEGYSAHEPQQPVIRVSWQEANQFCEWLSKLTGKSFRLPTEAQWEWAARGGSDQPFWFGPLNSDFGRFENLSDETTKELNSASRSIQYMDYWKKDQEFPEHGNWETFLPRADGVNDGALIQRSVGSYQANPFGLYDMMGNVCEWTASDYLPYGDAPGKALSDSGKSTSQKVVRGGSWSDRPKWSRAGVRKCYQSWQKVFNVGFRVICDDADIILPLH